MQYSQFKQEVQILSVNAKQLENKVHELAVQAISFAVSMKSSEAINLLLSAMPGAMRKNALREWALSYGPFYWSAKIKKLRFKEALLEQVNEEKATQNPFWEFKPEPEFKPFDLEKQIASLLARAVKRSEEGHEEDNIDIEKLEALAAIV